MSRAREFTNLRNSRSSHKSISSHTFSNNKFVFASPQQQQKKSNISKRQELICVNCINHSLSKSKYDSNQREKIKQKQMYSQFSQKNFHEKHTQTKVGFISEKQKQTREYNKKIMQVQDSKKKQQIGKKLEQKTMLECRIRQERMEMQKRSQEDKMRKQYWKFQIQKQIKQNQSKKVLQKTKEKIQTPKEFINKSQNESLVLKRKQLENQYRKDLLLQIKNQKEKKDKQKLNQSLEDIKQFSLLDTVEERNKKQKLIEEKRKIKLLEQAKNYHQQIQEKKMLLKLKIKRERQQVERVKKQMQKQHKEYQNKKHERMSYYLRDIKSQIDYRNKIKLRQKESEWTQNQNFIQDKVVDKVKCDSCEKKYPLSYLTKVHA